MYQGRLQVIICASHRAQCSLLTAAASPASEGNAEDWLPAMSLYAALGHFLSSLFFPLDEITDKPYTSNTNTTFIMALRSYNFSGAATINIEQFML